MFPHSPLTPPQIIQRHSESESESGANATANPDKVLRKYYTANYPNQVGYILLAFIVFLGLVRLGTFLGNYLGREGLSITNVRESENYEPIAADVPQRTRTGPPPRGSGLRWRRIHLAVLNAYRAIAFRTVVRFPMLRGSGASGAGGGGGGYEMNVAEAVLTVAYLFILFRWSFAHTTNTSGQMLDPRYYANRAGKIAALQVPFVVALSMKNNILSLVTGVGFDKLNYLHRMMSRSVFILLFIHMIGRVSLGLKKGNSLGNSWMLWGMFALIALGLLCVGSIRAARAYNYESFLLLHFCMVLVFLLGGYFHTLYYGHDLYIWPSFVLWALDRLVRTFRLIIFNYSYFGFTSGLGTFNATAEVAAPDFVRLTLRRPNHLRWSPGQLVYLTMPGVSLFPFESHPFTIANADVRGAHGRKAREEVEALEVSQEEAEGYGKDLMFLVNAKQGFTRRLWHMAKRRESLMVFLDGPYGTPPRIENQSTVVFIAGGSGVTFTNPLFVDLVHRAREDPSICQYILFIWSIRHPDHINLISEDLQNTLRDITPSLKVEIRVFVTSSLHPLPSLHPHQATTVNDIDEASPSSSRSHSEQDEIGVEGRDGEGGGTVEVEDEDEEEEVGGVDEREKLFKPADSGTSLGPIDTFSGGVGIQAGRPDIETLLTDAALATGSGCMSINVCGPPSLADRVRRHLRSSEFGPLAVLKGGPSVDLYIEAFNFAASGFS